jgi:hypothetical protein
VIARKWGALRDVHDVRDSIYPTLRRPTQNELPQRVDLRGWTGPVKDQGEEGSCTGHAFSSAREWIARKYEQEFPVLSPQFLYVEELIANGAFPKDEGAMPRTGCQVLTSKGCCEAAYYPYVVGEMKTPTEAQLENAGKYRAGGYHRIGKFEDFLGCLADAIPWPVTVGFTVYESFLSNRVAESGIMPIPKKDEEQQGGHEVLCLGYDLTKKLALMQNSWSDSWGQKGFFWMPFEVVGSPTTDLWVVHTGSPWK